MSNRSQSPQTEDENKPIKMQDGSDEGANNQQNIPADLAAHLDYYENPNVAPSSNSGQ